jgi:hypothetical protein
LAGEVTPEQEAAANDAANKILAALRAAKTPAECAAISAKAAKTFERLQEIHPVRSIHIINLAEIKKREFANHAPKTIPARGPRRRVATRQDEYRDLFD